MLLKELIHSFGAVLLTYQGKNGTYIKQKNEIAKKLLLTALQTHYCIQTSPSLAAKEKLALYLYHKLVISHHALSNLKGNKGGELDAIVKTYLKKWKRVTPIACSWNKKGAVH